MILCLTALLCTLGRQAAPLPTKARPLAIVGATLIDGTGAPPTRNSALVLRGGKIVAIGRRDQVTIPDDADTVDASGKWVIPGLVDLHVHLDEDISPTAYLLFGVTSVRDFGSRLVTLQRLRARAARGEPMPYLYWMGRNIDQDKPSWWGAVAVKSPGEVPDLLDDMARQGVDGVKLYVAAGPEVTRAVIQVAHRRGWPVTGHLERTRPSEAARMGIDNLEHVSTLLDELRKIPAKSVAGYLRAFVNVARVDLSGAKAQQLIKLLHDHHVAVTATLSVSCMPVEGETGASAAYSGWADVPKGWKKEWSRPYWNFVSTKGWRPKDFNAARNAYRKYQEMVRRLDRAGVKIVAGTDTPAPWVLPGAGLIHELELLVQAGLNPMTALRAATGRAAEVFGKSKEIGNLEVGRRADLVLLKADPLQDIRNLRQVSAVYVGGKKVDLERLGKSFQAANH